MVAVGELVQVRFTKWGGGRHWSAAGVVHLGEDEHGLWLGALPGTRWTRPGGEFATVGRQVMLVPPADRWFVATFFEPVAGLRWRLYVDITTPVEATGAVLTCVDLDLDVVHGFDGVVGVEDEDEFADHQAALGYPADVVDRAAAECERVVREMARGDASFAEATVAPWRDRFADLGPMPPRPPRRLPIPPPERPDGPSRRAA